MKNLQIILMLLVGLFTSCATSTFLRKSNRCQYYDVNPDAGSYFYNGKNFELKLVSGRLYKNGIYYKTTSRWEVRSKDGSLLSKESSQIYSATHLANAPDSARFDGVWIHDDDHHAFIAINEYGSGWFDRGTKTVIFEQKNNLWKSTLIRIPGPTFEAEGNGGFIHSLDINGNITYENPYAWQNHEKHTNKYATKHYSEFDVVEPFPSGNNW